MNQASTGIFNCNFHAESQIICSKVGRIKKGSETNFVIHFPDGIDQQGMEN